ncbi:MAG: HEAT repeat domain-containing protein [Opitutaceae bacterium]|nr:HEAT repeat domain-containing protein [Opitutaceae bacterium]
MHAFRSLLPALLVISLAGCVTSPNPKEAPQLAVLSSSTDLHEKARACQELGVFGGRAAVPALAALLNEEHLSDYARSGLEAIRDPAAGAALRQALPRLEGRHLAGAVNSLGVRREKAAVSDLRMLALDNKRGVAAEAVASLGMIGTADAARVLQQVLASGPAELRLPAAHASIIAAEHLAKVGNPAAARTLLDAVVRAVPSGPVATVAQNQTAALRARR